MVKKNKVVIVGAGNIAALFDAPNSEKILTHAHAIIENEHFMLHGCYDVNFERAQNVAKVWGTKAYKDIDEAIKNADIVICCVPDRFHYELLKELSTYSLKLVVTEKPLTETIEEALEISRIYKKNNIDIALNYSRRYLKAFQELRKEIRRYGTFLKGTGYYGKGICHNGSHMIDILMFLLESNIKILDKKQPISDFYDSDRSYDVNLQIADGIFEMKAIDCRIATIFEIDLFFEKARIRILDGGAKIEIYKVRESADYAGYYNYIISEERIVDYSQALVGLYENVIRHLKGEEELFCSVDNGVDVLRVCAEITRGEI